MKRSLIITAALFTGCLAPQDESTAPPVSPDALSGTAVPAEVKPQAQMAPETQSCAMTKFSFTQATGCANDGWVEFCAKKSGAAVLSRLRSIAPQLVITEGVIGNSGCSEADDYHVTYLLDVGAECTEQYGALSSSSWERLCSMAALPETSHFVPGWGQ